MSSDHLNLLANLGLGALLAVVTVLIHFWGLLLLSHMMRVNRHRLRPQAGRLRQSAVLLLIVLAIFVLHSAQIWVYALVFLMLDEFRTLEGALYFSTSSFTTVGFGDLVLSPRWRVLGAIEAANGWILFAWSTAFLIAVTSRLRLLEHEWLESDEK